MTVAERRQHRIQELVNHWFETDDELKAVYLFEIPDSDERGTVLLLQVTEATPVSPDEVVAYGFAPSSDFEFPLALAQVTPEEWAQIKKGAMSLPEGWMLDHSEIVRAA